MKKYIIVILGACLLSVGNSQTYHPIPTDSVWWIEKSSSPYLGSPDCISIIYRYVYPTAAEVDFNGNTYHVFQQDIKQEFWQLHPFSCPAPSFDAGAFYAYLRNDSINKKVYVYDDVAGQDILLYDFDVNMGDSIYPTNIYGSTCNDTFTVLSIDSIDIGGEYRRRIGTLSYYSPDTIYIMEGIGSTLGFGITEYCPFEYNTELVCYHYGNLEYGNTTDHHCTPYLSIEDPPMSLTFIYKQSDDRYYVDPHHTTTEVICFDIFGKFVMSKTFHEPGYLDLKEVSPGVYFLNLVHGGQAVKPYKLVVQH